MKITNSLLFLLFFFSFYSTAMETNSDAVLPIDIQFFNLVRFNDGNYDDGKICLGKGDDKDARKIFRKIVEERGKRELAQTEKVKALLEIGVRSDMVVDEDKRTALMHSVINQNSTLVALLLKNSQNIDRGDHFGNTAFHYAAQSALQKINDFKKDPFYDCPNFLLKEAYYDHIPKINRSIKIVGLFKNYKLDLTKENNNKRSAQSLLDELQTKNDSLRNYLNSKGIIWGDRNEAKKKAL